jgi:hypothetical protein
LTATCVESRDLLTAGYPNFEAVRLSVAADVNTTYLEAKGYAAECENAEEMLWILRTLGVQSRHLVDRVDDEPVWL